MATASRSTSDPLAVPGWDPGDVESKSERYVRRRLAEAGAEVKGIALTTFFLAAAVAAAIWLLLGVLAEHWLVPGGLPRGVRWTWLALAAGLALAAAVRWVLPLIRYRVNLVYAARAIEREHPELHNDVVNAVLAQARPDDATPFVVRSLRRRAAHQLSKIKHDGVVDYTPALRLAAVLAMLVVGAVLYELLAPKSLLVSTVRLVAPWVGIAAPSRVQIAAPTLQWRQPGGPGVAGGSQDVPVVHGTATLVRGRQLVVSTAIRNLRRGERPLLLVTPRRDAGSAASWRVPLVATKEGGFAAPLPDAARGLDESIDLAVMAGDAQTEPIRVTVIDAPTIVLREVTYHYPAYTGQEDRTVEWQGDLSAVEGTDVTVVAETNQPVDRAWIDFEGDGTADIELKPGQRDLARVRGRFTLRLNADRSGAEHPSYRLIFTPKATAAGSRETRVVDQLEHRIEVLPDLAPEVAIVVPAQQVVRVRPDAAVTVRVKAVDPDFGLASVLVETRVKDGPEKSGRDLLATGGTKRRRVSFEGDEMLVPARLGVMAGGVLEYRGVATDTRAKEPNVTRTPWQTLVIDVAAPPQAEPPPRRDDQDAAGDGAPGDEPADGEAAAGGRGPRSDADESGQRGDAGESRDDRPAESDSPEPELSAEQQRDGGEKKPSGDTGQIDGQQPKSRQNDPKPAADEGAPQQGEDQGSADGGKPQDGMQGKSGNQAGERQQDGSSDGAGGQPEGSGGAGQAGDQDGQGRDAADGASPQKPGAGGRERKPGGSADGRDSQATSEGGGQGDRREGAGSRKDRGTAEGRERVASDGTADGDAMERILEHRRASREDEAGGDSRPQSDSEARSNDASRKPAAESGGGKPGKPETQSADGRTPTQPPAAGQAEQKPSCNGSDGNPCGRPDCPACKGGSGGGGSAAAGGTAGAGEAVADGGRQGSSAATSGGGDASKPGSADGGAGGDQPQSGLAGGESGGRDGSKQAGGDAGGAEQAENRHGSKPGSGDGDQPQQPGLAANPGANPGGESGERGTGSRPDGGTSTDRGPMDDERRADPGPASGQEGSEEVAAADEAGSEGDPAQPSAAAGGGGAVGGGQRQQAAGATGDREDRPVEWTAEDLSHARNAADLALEHLRRSLDSGDREVLDELGWTAEQAREFLARWERMRRAAGADQRQRGQFDDAVKSLGIRPDGVRRGQKVPTDVKGGQAEGRRSRPPSDYREQFKAFLQGAAVE